MTLGAIWERSVKNTTELIVLSDSRLTGGRSWDCNPKIVLLPRSDAVISFAGSTDDAYPLILQAINSINMHAPALTRAMDITDLKGHLVRIFTHTQKFLHSFSSDKTLNHPPEAILVLSGYSWKKNRFYIWELHFDENINSFTFRPSTPWQGQEDGTQKILKFIGEEEACLEAKENLISLLRERGKLNNSSFDMEPFEIIRDIIRGCKYPSVGGAPQMVKIYKHSNSVPVGIWWPTPLEGKVCVLGRPLMDYEKNPWATIDPDSLTRT